MRRHRDSGNDTPGYDSFLDIVANLVGILVILIMVLGVQARDAWQQTSTDEVAVATDIPGETIANDVAPLDGAFDDQFGDPPATADALTPPDDSAVLSLSPPDGEDSPGGFEFPPLDPANDLAISIPEPTATEPPAPLEMPDVESVRIEAEYLRQTTYEMDSQLTQADEQLAAKSAYRAQLVSALNVAQKQVASYNAQIATVSLENTASAEQLAAAQAQLANLQGQIDRVSTSSKPEPIALNHRPAPLAQTVFGREEHFRLHAGRLSYVPMREIRDRIKSELNNKAWKLKQAPQVMETTGPIGDYYIRYLMVRSQRKIRTESGPVMRSIISLDHFELAPSSEVLGVPVKDALATGSQFQQLLSRYSPSEVTVTVWTYPDSYSQLRELKESLWQRGFLVATRPLPHGVPIGGSPDGSRSMAE